MEVEVASCNVHSSLLKLDTIRVKQYYIIFSTFVLLFLICVVEDIREAMQQVLQPIMDEMRENINSMKRDLTSLNETITCLKEDVEEHKNQTTSELADLQSSIDNPPIKNISDAVRLALLPYLNDSEENIIKTLRSNTDGLVSSLRGDLEMYKNWTMSELADLQTSIDSVPDATLLKLLPYMNNTEENLLTDLKDIISDRATSIDASVSSLSGDLEMYKNWTMSELADLQTSLQSSVRTTHSTTEQLVQLSAKIDATDSKILSLNTNMSQEFSSSRSQINAMLNPLNSKLTSVDATSTLMRDDLSCVKTDLSSLNDSMNRVCDKVEDHMTAELMELNEYLKENLTHQISSNENLEEYTCGGTGGWRRGVYLDMTDNNTDCPSGWRETGYSKRTCGRATGGLDTCDSATFPVSGGEYNQVCGRIKAYQWGYTSGFHGLYSRGYNTIDDAYFSGVAVMHGSPRQHIWTFAAGYAENYRVYLNNFICPCDSRYYMHTPHFVGEDYFCESGYIYPGYNNRESLFTFHSNDTLWDGRDCHSSSTCCSHHNPPYFTKFLNMSTNDNIELRICGYQPYYSSENVAVELIELYVKDNYVETKLIELDQHLKHQISTINNLGVHTCGGTGGWRRAVYLDMTDPNTDCPSGWRETGYSKRTCGRASDGRFVCDAVTFPVSGGEYSQVCGRIKAYQFGATSGFWGYTEGYNTIDDAYFSGVAVMHGSPRQHIWTFATGAWENHTFSFSNPTLCPCDTTYSIPIPPFVGEDHFCESGYIRSFNLNSPLYFRLHSNDTLWDGRDCHSTSTCCSQHNPPYFTKTLNMSTIDDIELRMCENWSQSDEDVAVELIELYVK